MVLNNESLNFYNQIDKNASRKEQALWIMKNVPVDLRSVMFTMLNKGDYEAGIWKIIKNSLKEKE